jgi:hypothetical protein
MSSWIKKAFDCLALCNARCKVERELDVELHGTNDDRELMARCNVRRKVSGIAQIDHSVSEFARRFTRHLAISLMSSLYYHVAYSEFWTD